MGYFSNGTEGMGYQERYCSRCLHDKHQNCPVWTFHLIYNGDQNVENAKTDEEKGRANAIRELLDSMIPRDGIFNGKCSFFIPMEGPPPTLNPATMLPSMREWAEKRGLLPKSTLAPSDP